MNTKYLMIAGVFVLAFTGSAQAIEQYKCFLETKAMDRTPVAILHSKKTLKSMKWNLEVIKSVNSNRTIFEADVSDKTESNHALYVNKEQGVEVSFFLDGLDALGFVEGSMKSPVMNGNIKCMEAMKTSTIVSR